MKLLREAVGADAERSRWQLCCLTDAACPLRVHIGPLGTFGFAKGLCVSDVSPTAQSFPVRGKRYGRKGRFSAQKPPSRRCGRTAKQTKVCFARGGTERQDKRLRFAETRSVSSDSDDVGGGGVGAEKSVTCACGRRNRILFGHEQAKRYVVYNSINRLPQCGQTASSMSCISPQYGHAIC